MKKPIINIDYSLCNSVIKSHMKTTINKKTTLDTKNEVVICNKLDTLRLFGEILIETADEIQKLIDNENED